MPPEELQKQIARVKEKEHAEAEKMHDIMLSHQHTNERLTANTTDTKQDKKKIVTFIAVIVLLVLGFIYAQKNGFWLNNSKNAKNKEMEQALKRMDEITKNTTPATYEDIVSTKEFMSDIRAQQKSAQTKKK
ncbi:MAG: hypothetical protein ACR2IQ_00275 [Minisyncoccia bacterium]